MNRHLANVNKREADIAEKYSDIAEAHADINKMNADAAEVEADIQEEKAEQVLSGLPQDPEIAATMDRAKEARVKAEVARSDAEKARGKAELARQEAETARSTAEVSRDNAEKARDKEEISRDQSETILAELEAALKRVESARNSADIALEASLQANERAEEAREVAEGVLKETQVYASMQELLARQEALTRRIIQAVHSGQDLNIIFKTIVDHLGQYLEADRCFISRYDSENCILSAPTQEYLSSSNIQSMLTAGPELWEHLCRLAQHVSTEEYNAPIDFDRKTEGLPTVIQDHIGHIEIESGIACAIKYLDQPLAILFIHQVNKKKSWTDVEKKIIRIVSEQIGIAIYQAQLLNREREAKKALEISNRDLEQFASVAAHDLQAPLRKVKVFAGHLKTDAKDALSPQSLEDLERMQSSVESMQNLINDLLALAKVVQSEKATHLESVNLSEVFIHVKNELRDQITHTQAQIDIEPLCKVKGDAVQIQQLFLNLLQNALKFQKAGSTPHIKVSSVLTEDHFCEILVADNGIGFDEAHAERVFGMFERLHGKSAFPGTGIGLAICRRVAERYGGSIQAKSEPGNGSTFIVRLLRA